jgi:hypothetical protein
MAVAKRQTHGTTQAVSLNLTLLGVVVKYLKLGLSAKAGIQMGTGCRIKSGMTE